MHHKGFGGIWCIKSDGSLWFLWSGVGGSKAQGALLYLDSKHGSTTIHNLHGPMEKPARGEFPAQAVGSFWKALILALPTIGDGYLQFWENGGVRMHHAALERGTKIQIFGCKVTVFAVDCGEYFCSSPCWRRSSFALRGFFHIFLAREYFASTEVMAVRLARERWGTMQYVFP